MMESNTKKEEVEVVLMESENSKKEVEDHVVQGKDKNIAIDQVVQNTGEEAIFSGSETKGTQILDGLEAQQNETSYVAIARANTPIWFTLVTSSHQDTSAPLQQIPNRYLRVKNVCLEVSCIQKYIAMKLGLQSENEVELYLRDLPLDSSIMLQDLFNYWIATGPVTEEVTISEGCSGAEYVMVLSYGRKSKRGT